MQSEQERLRKEISVIKEVIAIKKKKQEMGWSDLVDLEEEINIPRRFEYVSEYNIQSLETHLDRLQRDRRMLRDDDLFADVIEDG